MPFLTQTQDANVFKNERSPDCYIFCICRGNKIENSTFYTVTERCKKSTKFVDSAKCPLTSLTSSKVEFVAFQSQLLHFSLLLLQFLLLVLHFIGLDISFATFSMGKYIISSNSFLFLLSFATFYALRITDCYIFQRFSPIFCSNACSSATFFASNPYIL